MFEILIVKDLLYAKKIGVAAAISGVDELHLLDNGAVAVLNSQGVLVTSGTQLSGEDDCYIAVGGNGTTHIGSKVSELISRSSLRISEAPYRAAAKQVITVGTGDDASGADNFGTLVAGTYARLRIFDTTNATLPADKVERYEYKVKVGDTETIIWNAMIALINATSTIGTAAAVGATTGFKFTLNDYYKTAEIYGDDVMTDTTIDYTTTARGSVPMDFGIGMADQIAALEEEYSAIEGNSNKTYLSGKFFTYTPTVDLTKTYNTYNIHWSRTKQSAIKNVMATNQELVIAVETGGAAGESEAVLQTVFDAMVLTTAIAAI